MSEAKEQTLTLYKLINPSDQYTFYAPSVEVAGVCALLLSTGYGASPVAGDGESTPILFGWQEWLDERGINEEWVMSHKDEIADAYDSFLIGDAWFRVDVEARLAEIPEEEQKAWINERQSHHRTSMNQIGEQAYANAIAIRAKETQR